jgi:hypothetical protein
VLQHGFGDSLESGDAWGYVPILRADDQRMLRDARGHGASDKPQEPDASALPRLAGDIVAVLADAAGWDVFATTEHPFHAAEHGTTSATPKGGLDPMYPPGRWVLPDPGSEVQGSRRGNDPG